MTDYNDVELAHRLHAAWASHHLRLSGVDRTLKKYAGSSMGEYWTTLAAEVRAASAFDTSTSP